jgi:peroxin-6
MSLSRIASNLPFTYTGADLYALCSDAMLKAVTRQASLVDSKLAEINSQNLAQGKPKVSTAYFFDHYANEQDTAVLVTEEDFENAQKELVPSVSVKELEHYKRVRAQFEKPEDNQGKGKAIAHGERGIPDWQHDPQHERLRSNGKGKVKLVDRKGKGKERAWDVDDEEEGSYENGLRNGTSVSKGKGKTIDMGFQPGTQEDDKDLY